MDVEVLEVAQDLLPDHHPFPSIFWKGFSALPSNVSMEHFKSLKNPRKSVSL